MFTSAKGAIRRPPLGCIYQTDRPSHGLQANCCRAQGSQNRAHDDQKLLRERAVKVSTGGEGSCNDDSTVESSFKSVKAEVIWRRDWQTRREVDVALLPSHGLQANHCRATEYINGFYSPHRKHSALGWKSTMAFEQRAA